jgi:hypothetical protein
VKTLLGWIFVEPFWAGSGRLEEEPGAGLADKIMLSKATSSGAFSVASQIDVLKS